MIEESKYCSEVIKKHFIKELVVTKEQIKDFKDSNINVGFVIVIILIMMLKQEIIVIPLENIEALHIVIVISVLNNKIPVVCQNLKNCDSHLIMQELGKFLK